MKHFTLLKVDVTQNSPEDKKLLQKYHIFGPPAIIFYDGAHHEMPEKKIIGYKPPEFFITHLNSVLKGK